MLSNLKIKYFCMKKLLLKSYAKINLCLNITGKQEDGYHTLDMITLPLELHDSILLSELKNGTDNFVTIDDFSMGDIQYNLATFAIDTLQKKYKFKNKFRVFIHKVLPIQAGLGGGSSNAAATMLGVNKYLNLGLSNGELINVGKKLGADIPFFLSNKPSRVQGIGEKLTPITIKNNYYVLIVKPSQGCSTKEIYALADSYENVSCDIDNVVKYLADGNDDMLAESISNVLEGPAIDKVPEIKVIKDKLKEEGLKIVLMSGSGSSVFALSTDKKLIKKVADKLEDHYTVEVTRILK